MFFNKVLIANIYCFGNQKRTFCYRIDEKYKDYEGTIVKVCFGRKILFGIILSIVECNVVDNQIKINDEIIDISKIKDISSFVYKKILSIQFLSFLKKMAWYNIIEIERLMDNVVPSVWLDKKKELKSIDKILKKKECKNKVLQKLELNEEQQRIFKDIDKKSFNVSLIRGIMGSGKTYIFLAIVREKILENSNNQVLIMVPEIALTSNLIDIVYKITGIEPVIWHSSVLSSKKKIYYENIINGNVKIVISTRSGILLPYKNLSLIVVDEEHDVSYKQDEIPCYHARDMAILRAKYENIPVILCSATPSIETIVNIIDKKYKLYKIDTQFFHSVPPKVELLDIYNNNCVTEKQDKQIIVKRSMDSIISTSQKGEQSMVFINRRGYSRTLKCEECGYEAKCENCDNFLSFHKNNKYLKCHYCGYKIDNIEVCKNCGSKKLSPNKGVGVEQIEQEIHKFCNVNTIIFSSDELTKEKDIDEIMNKIKNENIDVIIGTQIMAKGYHFPRLTNIVVLDIDGMALDGDFRAFERMFQMLFQLSGRAGREKKDSTIYIQTANKNNNVLQAIKNHSEKDFYKNEIMQRKKFNLPPYLRFIGVIISSQDKNEAYTTAMNLLYMLKEKLPNDVDIFGPTESNLYFLKRNYRYRLLLKSKKSYPIQNQLNNIRKRFKFSKKVQIKFDVDCYNFL